MAGPSIAVRVLGDLSKFAESMGGVGKAAESTAQRASTAFHGMVSTLNASGVLGPFGQVLAGLDTAVQAIAEHGKSIGPVMMGVGGAVLGLGATLSAFGSKEQASHQQLQAAIEATGGSYDDYAKQIEAAIKHQERFGNSSAQTQDALRTLTTATHDPQKALQLLNTATDLAAAKHEDLNSAAGQLGKVYNGNTKLLKQFGIEIDKTTGLTKNGQTATQALAGVLAGQASASADTFMGKLAGIKTHLEDQVSMFGQKYGPALQTAGTVILAFGAIWSVVGPLVAGMELATLWPILLIVAAVAALIAIGYVIYRNWTTIWQGILAIVQLVWGWIRAYWPLILGILLGPVALAAALIFMYWRQILEGLQAVWNWIRGAWNSVYSFLVAPVVNAAVAMYNWFAGLPGRLAGVFAHMWDGIWDAFRGVINMVIDGWNSLHFGIPSIDTHIPGVGKIGGGSVGVPQIPRLAQGGLITADGLVYAHAGEAITPYRSGPAVVVQQATFATELDVESFMRRAAWVMQTQRV